MPVKKPAPARIPASARKVNVYDVNGEAKGEIELPTVFNSEFRPDVIRRAVVAAESNRRQVYAPTPTAGMRHVAFWPGKGKGMARTPRLLHGSGEGAQVPNAPGGRRAHPPKVAKNYGKLINRKENDLAKKSALAACADAETVRTRGHAFKDGITLPVVLEDSFEELAKKVEEKYAELKEAPQYSKFATDVLDKIGVLDDVSRAQDGIHVRSGRGKMRGRRLRRPKSLLVVVLDRRGISRCFKNMAGVDVASPRELSVEMLAPGGDAGRLMVISKKALEQLKGVPK